MMIAQVSGLKPGDFVHTLGDAHLYTNHLDQARLQLTRTPRSLPGMKINPEVKICLISLLMILNWSITIRILILKQRCLYNVAISAYCCVRPPADYR